MTTQTTQLVRAAALHDVPAESGHVVHLAGRTIALFNHGGTIYAVENRCPHMGFPLHRGSVNDGILTCHWHHARFDLASGGTFDQWADDALAFPVTIQDDAIWLDLTTAGDPRAYQRERLHVGLERNLALVIAKAVLVLLDRQGDPTEPLRVGLAFGTNYRQAGWSQGLTILACMHNLRPHLDQADQPRAYYHGLAAVARDCADMAPHFTIRPLPTADTDGATLKRWFRQFITVRDAEGAERCLISAVRAGLDRTTLADILFAAVTDYRYISVGHPADFTNKALEALDAVDWEPASAEAVITSLAHSYATAERMEEANSWRHPIDLIALLEAAFSALPTAVATGQTVANPWDDRPALLAHLLADDPAATVQAMLTAVEGGCPPVTLASLVSYAAALRIARFHTSNEFGDWDTALHTFTFANAIEQGLRRTPSPELLRGVFDAAISLYLTRFLNIPAARLPEPPPQPAAGNPAALLQGFPALLDRQQQVNEAGELAANYLFAGGDPARLIALLGQLLVREDRDFHTIQMIEAATRQYATQTDPAAKVHILVAAARYLAAHAPTMRAQGQTYGIALRLHRGERLFADDEATTEADAQDSTTGVAAT